MAGYYIYNVTREKWIKSDSTGSGTDWSDEFDNECGIVLLVLSSKTSYEHINDIVIGLLVGLNDLDSNDVVICVGADKEFNPSFDDTIEIDWPYIVSKVIIPKVVIP